MLNLKTMLVLSAIVAACYGDPVHKYYKKHHHHGLHHYHFLHYLTFLAIKLKIFFFLGTIFTISLVAGKIIGIIKLAEYMKNKHYHHEEKIVYVNPHEHQGHDYGGYPGGYASPSDVHGKTYPAYSPDFSVDHPPADAYIDDRYSNSPGGPQYTNPASSGRNIEENYETGFYRQVTSLANRLRQMNITEIALNEMGIKDEHCRKKFVCKADYNAQQNIILRSGIDFLRDVSYQNYKPNSTVTSEEECDSLHQQCKDQID